MSGGGGGSDRPPVNQLPIAQLTLPTGTLATGSELGFSSTGSRDPDGSLAELRWNFGDGSATVTQASPGPQTHIFSAAGTYTVRLTAVDNRGAVQSTTAQVTLTNPNQPPVPALGLPGGNPVAGQALAFDSSGSADADGSLAELRWAWGDNSADTLQSAPGPLSHTYAAAGTYSVSLKVTDNTGASRTQTASLSVAPANLPPTAQLVASAGSVWVGQALTLDASTSTDADGRIARYTWDFGDGNRSTGTSATASHAYAAQGNYTVRVTVTDDGGASASATVGVQVRLNQAPVAAIVPPGGSPQAGQTLAFSPIGSADPDGSIVQYDWAFGDGGTAVTTEALAVSHTYTAAGSYAVQLTVTDDQGSTSSAVLTLTVGAAGAPTASVQANLVTPITGQEIRLDPAASTAGSAAIARYDWAFGDGRTATSTTPDVQYISWPAAGTQTVSLTVTDTAGASNVATVVVTVASFAPTGRLNDSGIDWCSENITTPSTWVNNAVCSAVNWAGNLWGTLQDAYFGRDAQARDGTLTKIGAGVAGFDFTRLGADGLPLAIQNGVYSDTGNEADGTRWDCVRDNTTGLIWEVKRNDPTHLRHGGHTYGWYSTDSSNNGGFAGFETNIGSGAPCTGVADTTKCNTQSYTTAVNAQPAGQALCGFRDWRMPTVDELGGLALAGRVNPAIDGDHFPNTGNFAWSSSPNAGSADFAWYVYFYYGDHYVGNKSNAVQVRLVRSGQ